MTATDPLGGARLLVAEDDPVTAATLAAYFRRVGASVEIAGTGDAALAAVRTRAPDLLLLDVMLPGVDGLTVCREVRRSLEVPILLVSARTAEDDVVRGLELGADDYVRKPFSPREVVARARRALDRRRAGEGDRSVLEIGPVRVDLATREASVHGEALGLTRTEFDLLAIFLHRPGRVFTRGQLLERLSGPSEAGDRTVDTHLYNLRRKMRVPAGAAGRISTERGVGYRLLAEDRCSDP